MQKKFRLAILTGGPSLERGIALNSARSVLDHLGGDNVEIVPIYFDRKKTAYALSPSQLYSNTPADFDFKLASAARQLTTTQLVKLLKSCDLSFPVMHGLFGEDGEIQRFLERHKLPFVGTGSAACRRAFDKFDANNFIAAHGFATLPSALLKIYKKDHLQICRDFFRENKLTRAVVKPAAGGSSIGVFSVTSPEEAAEKAALLFGKRMDTRLVIEPFCTGTEFTVIILQNRFGLPVAILPTEIETSYAEGQIFDYRKKYLPTRAVTYHCPPRFSDFTIERIQAQAEQLFTLLGMRDFARFDGWLLPDGRLWFSDFNPLSGMEQNSFLFQQGARVGLTHREMLRTVVRHACQRYAITPPATETVENKAKKKPVHVLFGGATSERQVSLMSGTNVWLKLRRSRKYAPKPFLLAPSGAVWEVPYALLLNHTVEEILASCEGAAAGEERLRNFEERVRLRLALPADTPLEEFTLPKQMQLKAWIKNAPFAFLALHGGDGEDGTLQKMCAAAGVQFNGPNAAASALCMDKFLTGKAIDKLNLPGVRSAPKKSMASKELLKLSKTEIEKLWQEMLRAFATPSIIVKPQNEGCSSGIVRLRTAAELAKYAEFLAAKVAQIPPGTFENQTGVIEMPPHLPENMLFEPFIETDTVRAVGHALKHTRRTGWLEVTVGVLESDGKLRALSPSLTVAEGEVLSMEEKFQGGTGINITPPPTELIAPKVLTKIQNSITAVARGLGITGYSRIDAFVQIETGEVIIIEVNTLPALTPSTVIFHQALAEKTPLTPLQFLEELIASRGY